MLTLSLSSLFAGELKHIHKLKFWPLHSVLQDKYLIAETEAMELESFLQPMLHLHPEKRSSAQDMLTHEWLNGVIVQGEIDVHLANEAREEERQRIEVGKATAQELRMDVESQGVVNGESCSPPVDRAQLIRSVVASIVDPQLAHALRPIDPSLDVHHTNPPPHPLTSSLGRAATATAVAS